MDNIINIEKIAIMENSQQKIKIDNILWWVYTTAQNNRIPQPLCPIHHLRLEPIRQPYQDYADESNLLKCEDCESPYKIPRNFAKEKIYVIDKVDAKIFKGMKLINLDDESIPLAEKKVSSEDNKYFVNALLTKSKVGLRVVIYAGEKGKKEKTQIFVEPEIKRLSFDQKDLHPSDVFTKVEAIFKDKTKTSINKK